MGEVVSLLRVKEDRTPHAQGSARCISCKHTWQAVAPLGTMTLQCPSCNEMKGLWTHTFGPEPGKTQVYTCVVCESTHMTAYRKIGDDTTRFMCVGCGSSQSMESLFD